MKESLNGNSAKASVNNTTEWGTDRATALELIADALNLRTPTIYGKIRTGDSQKFVVNAAATEATREKQQKIKDHFKERISQDDERRERLTQKYNQEFNCVRLRVFTEFEYQTTSSWSRPRRVIGKAEVTTSGDNPRFIVTNLAKDGFDDDKDRMRFTPAPLYEQLYCARGEMENVLKQQVLDLKGDRMSTHHMASNQLRLWLATFAYMLMERVRAIGCQGTELAQATVGTLRLKLMKVAAQVKVSVRRVYVQISSAFPLQNLFRLCQQRLGAFAEQTG